MDICPLCGKGVRKTAKNIQIIDGKVAHKKCPTTCNKLDDEQKKDWKILCDTINEAVSEKPMGYYAEGKTLNWRAVTNQIKTLISQGYSYEEITYAVNIVVDEQGGFWGFGAVVNRIEGIVYKKRKRESQKPNGGSYVAKDTSKQVDLSSLMEDEEW